MNFLKNTTLILVLVLFSCNSTNKSVSDSSEKESKLETSKMTEAGFLAGEISFSKKEGDCPITIKVEGKNGVYYLDPINLSEDFKKEGEKVWFKFGPLRRMNRCEKASPISIIEVIKRN